MNSKYKTIKYKKNKPSDIEDLVSIEEPLEMVVRYKKENEWIDNSISITMRTPKNDEDLIVGLLFCEGIIQKISEIEKVESLGDKVGKFDLQNKIRVTLNNGENLDIKHLRRNFLTNSSCGVCGKTSMDSLEFICKTKINKDVPKIKNSLITKIPDLLRQSQSEFSKTGGIHASALFNKEGKPLVIKEDVGRHNALDKVIGHSLKNSIFDTKNQFIACSGRLSFELVQKISEIQKVELLGDKVGKFDLQNKIRVTLNSGENLDIKHLRRNFLTNSSCGVCGKTSMDSLEIICKTKINKDVPKIENSLITEIPELLRQSQSEFSKTGGIHASALFNKEGKALIIKEDVGRHNALDKVIGHCLKNSIFDTKNQFIACSGRLSFELVQKTLMANIGLLMGVGAPTSLAIDLAKRFDMTLIGFVKSDSFNIYCGESRILK